MRPHRSGVSILVPYLDQIVRRMQIIFGKNPSYCRVTCPTGSGRNVDDDIFLAIALEVPFARSVTGFTTDVALRPSTWDRRIFRVGST